MSVTEQPEWWVPGAVRTGQPRWGGGRGCAWGPGGSIGRGREVRPRSREVLLILHVKTCLLEEKGLHGAASAAAGERLGEVG